MLWLNIFQNDTPLLEEAPQGDASIALELGEQDEKAILALLSLNSYAFSKAAAALVMCGIRHSQREGRRELRPVDR